VKDTEDRIRLGVLAGSLRRASFTAALARSLPGLAPQGTEIVPLPSIGDLPLFNQDILDHGVPGALSELAGEIRAAGGVIIVSPEYNWSIPGVLKNALDWLSRLNPGPMEGKPVTLFTASPGLLGGARAQAPIRNVLHSLDCRILAKPEVQIAQVRTRVSVETDTITDTATADFIRERLEAFSAFVRRS